MSHVDYLCPRCDARVGTARVGAYADPLDPVQCPNCKLRLKFFDLLPRKESWLLKSGSVLPGFGRGSFVVSPGDGTTNTSPISSNGGTLTFVMSGYQGSPNDLISWGGVQMTDLALETFASCQLALIPDVPQGTHPIVITRSGGPTIPIHMVVSDVATTPPGSDPFQGGDSGLRFNDGGGTEGDVTSTSHVARPFLMGGFFSPENAVPNSVTPGFTIGQTIHFEDPSNPGVFFALGEFYKQDSGPQYHTATAHYDSFVAWDLVMTVLNKP